MGTLALIGVLFVQGLLMIGIIFLIHWHLVALTSVPWVRTPRWKTRRMLSLAGLTAGERMVDFGAIGQGVEMQWPLHWISRIRAWMTGVSEKVTFVRGDLFSIPMPDADVVFCYLFPELNARLEPFLKNRYPSGTRVVSRTFSFPSLPLLTSEKIGAETIYLYRIS